jgi:hypothetical protein
MRGFSEMEADAAEGNKYTTQIVAMRREVAAILRAQG